MPQVSIVKAAGKTRERIRQLCNAGYRAEHGAEYAELLEASDGRSRPAREPRRRQCPHRNAGRYCPSCQRIIGQDGYPAT
jgi:hypothetical protein